jgi:hypothetical protein
MKPFRIQVNRLIDFGAIVTLIGVDAETSKPVTIHVDYRPLDVVWAAWRNIGSKQPIEYAVDGLTLSLGVAADDQNDPPLAGETQPRNPSSPNRFRKALQIVDPGASNPAGIAHAIGPMACAWKATEGNRLGCGLLKVCSLASRATKDAASMTGEIRWAGRVLGRCRRR